jgi:hypothetical protein
MGRLGLTTPLAELDRAFDVTLRGRSRDAVRVAGNLVLFLPESAWRDVLLELRLVADQEAWRMALATGWIAGAFTTRRAAGDAATLIKWFKDADFPATGLPFLRSRLDLSPPPAEQIVFRGGRSPPRELAAGWSWTAELYVAADYADRPLRRPPDDAGPRILRRAVRAEEILLRVGRDPTVELVVVPPTVEDLDRVEIESDDPRPIADLCAAAAAEVERNEAERRRVMDLLEEELWGGWGDEPGQAGTAG